MKKIAPNDPEAKSADLVAAIIDQLKALFPEAFVEGKVDFDVLKQFLGGAVDERDESIAVELNSDVDGPYLLEEPFNGKR